MSDRKAYLDEMNALKGITVKGWPLVVLFVFVSVLGFGQSARFSNFYDSNNGAGLLEAVIMLENGSMMAVGSNLNFSNGSHSDGHHVVIDGDGNLLSETAITFSGMTYNTQALIKTSAGAVFSSGYFCDYTIESPGYCDFYFARLDETGDTLFTKVIERPDTSDLLLSMVETRPNKIMLIGWTYNDTTNADADLLFITVDTLGNEVNRVVFGGGGTDYVHSGIVINEDGDVLMTGYTASFQGNDNDTWLIKTDSIGNVLWQRTYNHLSPSNGDSGLDIAKLQDDNFVVVGSFDNSSNTEYWAFAMKVDSGGNEIWTKRYENTFGQAIYACEVLNNGSILAVGQTSNTGEGVQGQGGWLVKMDENGDTLWTRTYNPSANSDLFRNMLVMPNGDIVMVGFGRGQNSTTQDGWILRVDSMGCLVENCFSVGVEELEQEEHYLSVYPNPASALVQIQRSSLKLLGILVRDVMGRDCFSRSSFAMTDRVMDVSNWPNGVYLISVTDEQGNNFTQRLVVQH